MHIVLDKNWTNGLVTVLFKIKAWFGLILRCVSQLAISIYAIAQRIVISSVWLRDFNKLLVLFRARPVRESCSGVEGWLNVKQSTCFTVLCRDPYFTPILPSVSAPCKKHRERKCADTIGTVLVFCMGWQFPVQKYKYIFQIKYTEAILSDITRRPLWFEITKMRTAV